MSKIIVVDENDNEIGVKERSEITHDDIYRVSGLWLTNSRGEILLAQRSLKKDKAHDPGKWGPAVAGTVEDGETYEANIEKEIEEELGVKGLDLKKTEKKFRDTGVRRYFVQVFTSILDRPAEDFIISKNEVEQVKWFSKAELRKWFQEKPDDFISTMQEIFEEMGVLGGN
ncbi:MAG: NUDIX domain-containing protein [Patescibacteria group bacterium]